MQSQLEKTKAEYEKRLQDIKGEAEGLQNEISGLQAAKAELEKGHSDADSNIQQAREEALQQVRGAQVRQLVAKHSVWHNVLMQICT